MEGHVVPVRALCSLIAGLVSVAGAASPVCVWASEGGISEVVFRAEACNDSGSGSFCVFFDEGVWDPQAGTFQWVLSTPVDILDSETSAWVASVQEAEVFVSVTEIFEIDLNVGLTSGSSDTDFVCESPWLSFEVIPNDSAEGKATASLTITDVEGDDAYLIGLGTPGTGAFRAYYNGYLGEGTRFTHLVSAVSVTGGGTANAWQADPTCGYRSFGSDVGDISTEVAMRVTPNDLAYATTTMCVPEPVACLGDIDGDGHVDLGDLAAMLSAYGTQVGDEFYNPAADFDENGLVDLSDLAALLSVYGTDCS